MNLLFSVLLQAGAASAAWAPIAGVIVAVIAAAFGISLIGKSAMEAIARQPQAGSDVRTSMIIVAALIEGVALFAIVVCGFILG
ncbi:MAG: ATP synthase F0 subunit C [Bacteroidales bacterium]|jgi:F-type H+-transporting ATPase subunit c|nr:ATP synthase F0 subunit C [Bacteroidales bacterium]